MKLMNILVMVWLMICTVLMELLMATLHIANKTKMKSKMLNRGSQE